MLFRPDRLFRDGIHLVASGLLISCFCGCDNRQVARAETNPASPFQVGHASAGEGNETAVIHLIVGDKSGPAGTAFSVGLTNQRPGHPALVTVLNSDIAVKPSTLLVAQVTIDGIKEAKRFFGPVQAGVAKGVIDSVSEGVLPRDKAETAVVIVTAFVHPSAEDSEKLERFNYEATKIALKRAMNSEPTADAAEQTRKQLTRVEGQ
jgi:5,6,7,8-tetrahydromethanopterin hydro-lyase